MDMHLHAGMERTVDMSTWIDLAVKDGRKVLFLLDHIELYRRTQADYDAWRAKSRFFALYPLGAAGHRALMTDFDTVARRTDVAVFKGWEVSEGELDSGLEDAPLRMADVLGFHISPNNRGAPPNGQTLIRRARQLLEAQKKYPVPMILFHPFPMRIENIQNTARKQGRAPKTITAAEYRFFRPGEQEELIRLLKGTSIYVEMNWDTEAYWNNPACREALIADIKPLAEGGVQFTVGSDSHYLAHMRKSFRPASWCEPAGVTPLNTNTIVRELLAIRARRVLEGR
jgi:histidinol phosphatase-like PHP family hydrolase